MREGLRRQTVIWRQLLTGDKAPEAYLDRHARAALHDDLRALIWRRYRRWAVVLAAATLALLLAWPHLDHAASAILAAAGALGLTKASVLLTLRGRLDQWSRLLWDRALAQAIVDATLTLDAVLPAPARERRLGVAVRQERLRRGVRAGGRDLRRARRREHRADRGNLARYACGD